MRIVLGVAAGIAAYKACELLRLFTEAGHDVVVVPTPASLHFVGSATWEALSGHPVHTQVWEGVPSVEHVALGRSADLIVVAPATADLLSRAASGRADDLLTSVLLTASAPILFAPAMHTEMWQHPATVSNVATLRTRGVTVMDPASGRLTGADSGPGRLPDPADVARTALSLLRPRDLHGLRVLVTAGGTREPIDPVRFLGNRSSGRQGWALAETALARGAEVDLIAASVSEALADPPGARVIRVATARELQNAVLERVSEGRLDAVVMAAAVADYEAATVASSKLKKQPGGGGLVLDLVRTPDVLAGLVAARVGARPVLVGFAAETGDADGDVLAHGRAKLAAKGCDLLVVNDVTLDGAGFGSPDNAATILERGSEQSVQVSLGPKTALADAIWDRVLGLVERS